MPERPSPRVAAVVLNYRRAADTLRCLRSLESSGGESPELIVVDNGSGDGSAERIAAGAPSATLVRSPVNLGYAAGNNLGLRLAFERGADFVLVMNNDCVAGDGALAAMLEAARRTGAGIASPLVCDLDDPGRIQYAGYRNIHLLAQGIPLREGARAEETPLAERELNAAPGCAMLLSRRLLATVGLFDEQFFAYSEELDLCRRAVRAGFRIVFTPRARVLHAKGATLSRGSPDYLFQLTRGRLTYARKHLGMAAFLLVFMPYFLAAKVAKPLLLFGARGRWGCAAAPLRAMSAHLGMRVSAEGTGCAPPPEGRG